MREEPKNPLPPVGETPTTRRRFFQLVGGSLAAAYLAEDALAAPGPVERPSVPVLRPPRIPPLRPRLPTDPQGGDEKPLPGMEVTHQPNPDKPPSYGPLLVMERPGYDPTPAGTTPYLYANRFFEGWNETAADWFGSGQLAAMRTPSWGWLSTTPLPPGWCAVSTVWNKGREPAFGVMMRALCLGMAQVSATEWREVCRADLGYIHLGVLTPGDYLEVRYPVSTVRDGMKALDDFLVANDPNCTLYPRVWYFHKCFAFDPVGDPYSVKPPIVAPDPPRGVIGGRRAAGWRWEVPAQTPGTPRVRHFG